MMISWMEEIKARARARWIIPKLEKIQEMPRNIFFLLFFSIFHLPLFLCYTFARWPNVRWLPSSSLICCKANFVGPLESSTTVIFHVGMNHHDERARGNPNFCIFFARKRELFRDMTALKKSHWDTYRRFYLSGVFVFSGENFEFSIMWESWGEKTIKKLQKKVKYSILTRRVKSVIK